MFVTTRVQLGQDLYALAIPLAFHSPVGGWTYAICQSAAASALIHLTGLVLEFDRNSRSLTTAGTIVS